MTLRTHTCDELRTPDINQHVTLIGWIQRLRDKGGIVWIDLRDGYGITQLILEEERTDPAFFRKASRLGREFVIQATGTVVERQSKNSKMATGDIEIRVETLNVISRSETPPFTLEDETDGGDELRMQYRYLDLRRDSLHKNLQLRHLLAKETRLFLEKQSFLEVETPMLIKSTPEGARDFLVPSRLNKGEFYALPQSPQLFKQLLMVSGIDRYYQLVKCFRDEDFRADRQPEFTQIDCEMAFVEQEDVLYMFEKLIMHLFREVKGIAMPALPRIGYEDAIKHYGSDKPDTRFEMLLVNLDKTVKGRGFPLFDKAELVLGICAKQCASYTRKQIDKLAEGIKKSQADTANPLIYARYNTDGFLKSSVDKFYNQDELKKWSQEMNAKPGDLMLLLAGNKDSIYHTMGKLRLHLGNTLGLLNTTNYAAVWVVDFPLFEWDHTANRFYAKHHPFTAPKPEDIALLHSDPGKVRANAYDLVINGVEIGGGSIRIHEPTMQRIVFDKLGLAHEKAEEQFGFLTEAFKYGAPPHGGIAIGFDRLCSLFGGTDSIRDFIAFPKNNAGKDTMANSPSPISRKQLEELGIALKK